MEDFLLIIRIVIQESKLARGRSQNKFFLDDKVFTQNNTLCPFIPMKSQQSKWFFQPSLSKNTVHGLIIPPASW